MTDFNYNEHERSKELCACGQDQIEKRLNCIEQFWVKTVSYQSISADYSNTPGSNAHPSTVFTISGEPIRKSTVTSAVLAFRHSGNIDVPTYDPETQQIRLFLSASNIMLVYHQLSLPRTYISFRQYDGGRVSASVNSSEHITS